MALGDDGSPLSAFFVPVDSREIKRARGFRRLLVAVVAVALIPTLNSTFAPSITLSNGSFEFGQGSAQANTCDASINVAVNNSYDAGLAYFALTSLGLSGIDSTPSGCLGKTLILRAYGADGSELDLNGSATAGNELRYVVATNSGTNASQDLAVTGSINAASVTKVSIETT